MVNYVLSDVDEFIGVPPYGRQIEVFALPGGKDDPNTKDRGFAAKSNVKIGTSSSDGNNYNGLRIFNGTITGQQLDKLFRDLNNEQVLVNVDGFMYLDRETRRTRGQMPTSRLVRLNEVFSWENYVDNARTFKAEKATTVWNRWSYTKQKSKPEVDYGKLDADLKKATDDAKSKQDTIDDQNITLGANETTIETLRAKKTWWELGWVKAATISARPLPSKFFERWTLPKSGRAYRPLLTETFIAQAGRPTVTRVSDPGSLNFIRPIKTYGSHNDFDPNYWWAVTLYTDGSACGPTRLKIAYYDGLTYGDHPDPCKRRPWPVNADPIELEETSGFFDLRNGLGTRFCVVIGSAS